MSPILRGGQGLGTFDRVMRTLINMGDVSVNQTMGIHVQVNIADLTLAQLKKVCPFFCKYEESALDSMMPPSRRGSHNNYCESNRHAVGGPHGTNASIHQVIASCNSIGEFSELVNPQKYSTSFPLSPYSTATPDSHLFTNFYPYSDTLARMLIFTRYHIIYHLVPWGSTTTGFSAIGLLAT